LLAIPAVIASGLYEFIKTAKDLDQSLLVATAVATIVSFAVGFSVIVSLLKYLSKGSFMPFVVWRVAVGTLLIILLSNNVLSA
jgi:undecaprenyl-diphosphatase